MKNQDLKGRDFLTWMDFTRDELSHILETAIDLKDKLKKGENHEIMSGLAQRIELHIPNSRFIIHG